jgi:hypothetical protein
MEHLAASCELPVIMTVPGLTFYVQLQAEMAQPPRQQ